MNQCGALMEWYWHIKPGAKGKNLSQCFFCSWQTTHELAWNWTLACMAKGWWVTTWSMVHSPVFWWLTKWAYENLDIHVRVNNIFLHACSSSYVLGLSSSMSAIFLYTIDSLHTASIKYTLSRIQAWLFSGLAGNRPVTGSCGKKENNLNENMLSESTQKYQS